MSGVEEEYTISYDILNNIIANYYRSYGTDIKASVEINEYDGGMYGSGINAYFSVSGIGKIAGVSAPFKLSLSEEVVQDIINAVLAQEGKTLERLVITKEHALLYVKSKEEKYTR